jgi:hypothetical protein
VAFEVHRAEALRQIELAAKRGLQACMAVAITYAYGMGGYDGTVRAEGRITAQFKTDTNNGRTARRHISLGGATAKRLRQVFGKGAEDDTCSDVLRSIRDAADIEAARAVVETWLAMPPRNVTCMATLNEWLNENEYKAPAKPEKAEKAEAEAEAEAPQSEDDKRSTAIESIVAGIERRATDLHFKPEHFGVLAVAMVKHCHGEVLAGVIAMATAQQEVKIAMWQQAEAEAEAKTAAMLAAAAAETAAAKANGAAARARRVA